MRYDRADEIWATASAYSFAHHASEIEAARRVTGRTFTRMRSGAFLEHYCWVVFASGFRASIVEAKFAALSAAFAGFDLTTLVRERPMRAAMRVFGSKRKCGNFLDGAELIHREGFARFKNRVVAGGVGELVSLPGIGEVTANHLAKNIGLADVEKNDVWIVRIAEACATTPAELIDHYVARHGLSRHVVDIVLWFYTADNRGGVLKG